MQQTEHSTVLDAQANEQYGTFQSKKELLVKQLKRQNERSVHSMRNVDEFDFKSFESEKFMHSQNFIRFIMLMCMEKVCDSIFSCHLLGLMFSCIAAGLPLSLRLTHTQTLCALLPARHRNYSLFFHVQSFTSFSQLWCAIVNAKDESNSSPVIDDCMLTIYYILATFLSNVCCGAYRTHSESCEISTIQTHTQRHTKRMREAKARRNFHVIFHCRPG